MRVPKLSKKAESSKASTPTTASEFLEQGSIDEESGDRWLGSDLAKSLRFYDKAYLNYAQATRLDGSLIDAYYNASRLLLHVYQIVKKVPESNSIIMENKLILNIAQNAGQVSNDLLYNYAIVNLEWLELQKEDDLVSFDSLIEVYKKISGIFEQLLKQQTEELTRFVQDLENIDSETSSLNTVGQNDNSNPSPTQEELISEDGVIQPTDLFETVLSAYKLIQVIFENASSNDIIPSLNQLVLSLLDVNDTISHKLITNYSEASHITEMVSNISSSQINELKLIKLNIVGLMETDPIKVIDMWTSDQEVTNDVAEKYMIASDNLQSLLDRNDINLTAINNHGNESDKDVFWKILTFQNNMLKKAQELVNNQMQTEKKNNLQSYELGSLIGQLSEIIIARADIEVQRSSIVDYPTSVNNHQVLFNNSKNLLKNAMNIANLNGGLRERIIEKIHREQCKLEAVFRLCLLEGKTSIEELDKIMTRPRWTVELPNLKKLGIYDGFGINDIIKNLE
ncbi:hypothetical protein SBY92_003610 [Candida maltosa Xu316]